MKTKLVLFFCIATVLVFTIIVVPPTTVKYDGNNVEHVVQKRVESLTLNEIKELAYPVGCVCTVYKGDTEVHKYTYFYGNSTSTLDEYKSVMFPFYVMTSKCINESSGIEDGMIYTLCEFDKEIDVLYINNPKDCSWVACSITTGDLTFHYSFFSEYGWTEEERQSGWDFK